MEPDNKLSEQLSGAIRDARQNTRDVLEGLGDALGVVNDMARAIDCLSQYSPEEEPE